VVAMAGQAPVPSDSAAGNSGDCSAGFPVAKVIGADEYGPLLVWHTHWAELIGERLYARPAPEALLWQIMVAGPAGYVRREAFAGSNLAEALENVRKQGFAWVEDEDSGFPDVLVKMAAPEALNLYGMPVVTDPSLAPGEFEIRSGAAPEALGDWNRISAAAAKANDAYGQWMPERWLQLFVGAYNNEVAYVIAPEALGAAQPVAYIQGDHLVHALKGAHLCRVEAKFREGFGMVPIWTEALGAAKGVELSDDDAYAAWSEVAPYGAGLEPEVIVAFARAVLAKAKDQS